MRDTPVSASTATRPRDNIPLALAFIVPLLVYLITMAPDLTWAHNGADGGDLVTAAYTLGLPHPPGYPTYTVLAWLFTRLPWGSVAWRVNLLSAVSSATSAALLYWITAQLASRQADAQSRPQFPRVATLAGLGAAWSYAFTPLIWSQALIAEVYSLTGLWSTVLLTMTLYFSRSVKGSQKAVSAAFTLGLVWSLGLGVHLTLLFLAPPILWCIGRNGLRAAASSPPPWRSAVAGLTGFIVGMLVWAYLPLRAGRGGVTWGQPTNWQGFWWMVSGALYRDYVLAVPRSALGGRLAAWASTWTDGLGLIGITLALWGVSERMGEGAYPSKGWWGATGLSFIAFNLYALGYHTADSVVYLVPAFVTGCLWLGAGLTALGYQMQRWSSSQRGSRRHPPSPCSYARLGRSGLTGKGSMLLISLIAMAIPATALARHWAALDLSDEHSAPDFCRAVLQEAPPDAVLLTSTDRQTFALWYCQQVKGLRPDVAVVDQGLTGFDWYRAGLQQAHPDLWITQAHAGAPARLTEARPQCQVRREVQERWLDCQE